MLHSWFGELEVISCQVRNNMHRAAIMLGAAVLHKVGRVGSKLREHHNKMREEGVHHAVFSAFDHPICAQ
jgi:hypothetical protein